MFKSIKRFTAWAVLAVAAIGLTGCGDPENGCGCAYCWSCNACEACLNDDDANCRFITTTS